MVYKKKYEKLLSIKKSICFPNLSDRLFMGIKEKMISHNIFLMNMSIQYEMNKSSLFLNHFYA